jgi:hypothetical protein
MFTRKLVLKKRKEKNYEEEPEITLPMNVRPEESFTHHKATVEEVNSVRSYISTETFKTEDSVIKSNASLQNICLTLSQYIQTNYGGLGSFYPISIQMKSQLRKDQQVLDAIIEKTKSMYVHSRPDPLSSKNHMQKKQSVFKTMLEKTSINPFKKTVASFELLDAEVKTIIYEKAETEWLKLSKKENAKREDGLVPAFDLVHSGSTLLDVCIILLETMKSQFNNEIL